MPPLTKPFAALRPRAAQAAQVVAPPYDVVGADEARQLAAGRPASFLHVSRPEIDLPPGTDPYSDAVYAAGRAALDRLRDAGVLIRDPTPAYYVYRMRTADHEQTGIALTASVRAYESNRIRKHELTRPDKENDRVRHIEALNAQTGPVLCAHRAAPAIDAAIAQTAATEPLVSVPGPNGVEHTLWRVDAADQSTIDAGLNALDALYIADGHHRSAAAARVAALRRRDPAASHEYFLCVAFSQAQMRIHDYNRIVTDLGGLTAGVFLERVAEAFEVAPSDAIVKPARRATFGMYCDGRWHRLTLHADRRTTDPVDGLDVSLLQRHLLEPILGIDDPRTDPRIDFVGGVRGLSELERRVDSGSAAAAFALHPTRLDELMTVADAGRLMPPKSTWFEPKLADGLLSHVLD